MSGRRSNRISHHDYTAGVYFITLVTHGRRRLFGEVIDKCMVLSPAGEEVQSQWKNLANLREGIRLDEFIVMPDHFHAVIWLRNENLAFGFHKFSQLPADAYRQFSGSQGPSLSTVLGSYKSGVSRILRLFDPSLGTIWQRDYFEKIVRNQSQLLAYRKYIRNNPAKWKS